MEAVDNNEHVIDFANFFTKSQFDRMKRISNGKRLKSESWESLGCKWRLHVYPKGVNSSDEEQFRVYLHLLECTNNDIIGDEEGRLFIILYCIETGAFYSFMTKYREFMSIAWPNGTLPYDDFSPLKKLSIVVKIEFIPTAFINRTLPVFTSNNKMQQYWEMNWSISASLMNTMQNAPYPTYFTSEIRDKCWQLECCPNGWEEMDKGDFLIYLRAWCLPQNCSFDIVYKLKCRELGVETNYLKLNIGAFQNRRIFEETLSFAVFKNLHSFDLHIEVEFLIIDVYDDENQQIPIQKWNDYFEPISKQKLSAIQEQIDIGRIKFVKMRNKMNLRIDDSAEMTQTNYKMLNFAKAGQSTSKKRNADFENDEQLQPPQKRQKITHWNELRQVKVQRDEYKLLATSLTAELDKLRAQNESLQQALEQSKIEKDKYKLVASSLRDQILNGTEPRVQLFDSRKSPLHGNEWTENVKLLYDKIENEKKQQLISEHQQKLTAIKRKSVKEFLDLNDDKVDYKNPNVLKKNGHILTLNEIVSKEEIKIGHRIPALVGELGVFAKMNIPKNLVLGRYIGFECTNKEWNEIFDHTNVDATNGQYLFSFDIDKRLNDDDDGSRSVTIDPMYGNMNEFSGLYVNDIRKNIYEPQATPEDELLQNCEFFTFCYRGWPVPVIVTTKKIEKGQELLLDYGVNYSILLKQNARWNKIMKITSNDIVKNIVKDVNLNDKYQL